MKTFLIGKKLFLSLTLLGSLAIASAHNIPHEETGDSVQIATDSSRDIAKILLDSCQPKKMLTRPATLEDVFLKLTGRTLRD